MPERGGERGQASVEWVGLVCVLALAILTIGTIAGAALPGVGLARALADRLVCVAGLEQDGCGGPVGSELAAAYGPELAALVRRKAPTLAYEEGMRALPVDFRSCRRDPCSMGGESGEVLASATGDPVTLFVHVVDCRGDPPSAYDCTGERDGRLYLQYWAYYPGSQSWRALRDVAGNPGHHQDDWESWQLRITGDAQEARASSHHGYNHTGGAGNWLSDVGVSHRAAWGPGQGRYYVSGGSHAGHAFERGAGLHRLTPGRAIRLIPIEEVARGRFGDTRFAVTPPWRKRVYRDPEYEGTD